MKSYTFEIENSVVYADVNTDGSINLFCPDGMDEYVENEAYRLTQERIRDAKRQRGCLGDSVLPTGGDFSISWDGK